MEGCWPAPPRRLVDELTEGDRSYSAAAPTAQAAAIYARRPALGD